MKNVCIKNMIRKFQTVACFIFLGFISLPVRVYADDPWEALAAGEGSDNLFNTNQGVKDITSSLFRIFQRIGIYGCIITTLIFLGMMALRWGDPRVKSESKSKIIWKFVVCFIICATTSILSLFLQILKESLGY